jgi:TetR/AcrR family transcriptional regulator, transcriptional repressor for nem operon
MRKGERTRHMILEKAAPIFNSKGYSGTALVDLMQATGLEKGGIYRHFSSKEELAAAAFDHAWSVVSAPRFAALDASSNGVQRLKTMISNFAERPAKNMPGGCPLLNTAIEADDNNTALRTRAKRALEEWKLHVINAVEQGIRAKQLRRNTDPEAVAVILIATLEGALMISRLERDRRALQQAKDHLFAFIDSLAEGG